MGRLNRLIAADHGGVRFMTMHLSVIDSKTGTMRWVSAGHDPVLVYDLADGSFTEVGEGDLPLGVMDDTEYREQTSAPLKPGQILFIGTDGVWEMPNSAGEQFGKPRVRDAIQSAAAGTASDIVTAILDGLAAFRGDCAPVDDVTFVVVKVMAYSEAAIMRNP
jgi:serine phosphatase RsbU (regulator of sigma subunit)